MILLREKRMGRCSLDLHWAAEERNEARHHGELA